MSLRERVRSLVAVTALLLVPAVASAQTTTTAPADTTQAAPAAPADATPAAPATQSAPADAVQAPAQPAVTEVENAGPAPVGKKKAEEEITVTGSRVRRKDLTTDAPVTVISREQLQASGVASVGDFLQLIPSQGNALNTNVNNGGDGETQISLRSLGAQRTLVLVDGKRFVAGGDGAGASVDLNTIPTAAIERIEILKDGASAVYGSDAIAGVVNIITRHKFDGTEASAYASTPTTGGGGEVYDLSVISGASSDKGAFVFGAGYYDQNSILAGSRDWARSAQAYDYTTGQEHASGSSAIPDGNFSVNPTKCAANGATAASRKLCTDLVNAGYTHSTHFIYDPSNPASIDGFRKYAGAADSYNFQAVNYLVTPSKRISLFTNGEYHLTDFARAYFQATYVNRQSDQQLAPSPFFSLNDGFAVSGQNPYNPFGVDIVDVRRRLVELAGRVQGQDLDTARVVTGVDGTLGDWAGPLNNWFYDVNFNYGRTTGTSTTNGSLNTVQSGNALGPGFADPTSPTGYTCGTAAAPIPGCVPANVFGGPGSLTQAMIPSLGGYTGVNTGFNQQVSAQANISGELFKLAADRPIAIAAGYEFRREVGAFQPNPIAQAGTDSDFNAKYTAGSFNVNEGYAELSIPVVSNIPFVEDLELQAAVRVSNYNTFGTDTTYKFGAIYKPIHDLTLRGTVSTGFRAPAIGELFLGQADSFEGASDPCSPTDANGNQLPLSPQLAQQCGAAAGNSNNAGFTQIKSHVGGNPNLQPEKANIFTAGAVFEPAALPGFSATADFYDIRIYQNIGVIGTPIILQGCYPGAGGTPNAAYCNLVQRDAQGNLIQVTDTNQNVGSTQTTGIDLSARYVLPTEVGRFGFVIDGTWLTKFQQTIATGAVISGQDNYDLGANPAVKANGGVLYSLGGFSAGVNARFIGSFHECANPNGASGGDGLCYQHYAPTDNNGNPIPGAAPFPDHGIPNYITFDLNLSYLLKTSYGESTIALGVRNLANTDPPRVYDTAAQTNSDPSTYDYVGRVVYARLSHRF